jgi:hypothetical protein
MMPARPNARQTGTPGGRRSAIPIRPPAGVQLYAAKAYQPLGQVPLKCIGSGFTRCSALHTGAQLYTRVVQYFKSTSGPTGR